MSRVVVLASSQDGLCFPPGPASRVIVNEGGALLPITGLQGHPLAQSVCSMLTAVGIRPSTVDTLQSDECFVLVISAEVAEGASIEALRQELITRGKQAGLSLRMQREDVFRAMHRI